MSFIDWLWWIGGGAIGSIGLMVLARALFVDRSRGRRRCPKCWYSMEGHAGHVGGRCPECGREQKREKRMYRTRRHWRMAALGVLLVTVGGACFFAQRVHQHGWGKATPTTVHIVALPYLDVNAEFDELAARVYAGALWDWQYRMLVRRLIGMLEAQNAEPVALMIYISLLQHLEYEGANLGNTGGFYGYSYYDAFELNPRRLVSDTDCNGAIDALVGLFDHDNPKVSREAQRAVASFVDRAGRAFPALLGQLSGVEYPYAQTTISYMSKPSLRVYGGPAIAAITSWEQDEEVAAFCELMSDCGSDMDCAMRSLADGLNHDNWWIRAIALYGISVLGEPVEHLAGRILELGSDPTDEVRQSALGAITTLPFVSGHEAILRGAVNDRNREIRLAAYETIVWFGQEAHTLSADLEARIASHELEFAEATVSEPWFDEAVRVARALISVGGDSGIAMAPIIRQLDHRESSAWLRNVLEAVLRVDAQSPEHIAAVEQLMAHEDYYVKVVASHAYALLGGDTTVATRTIVDSVQRWPRRIASMELFNELCEFARRGLCDTHIIAEMLESDDPTVIRYGVQCLEVSGARAAHALPRLRELADDELSMIANAAKEAIRRIELAVKRR